MYDVRQLRVLREVAARGSFSAAADALDYTQSAVSKQIAALERDAGAPLIERAVRPLRLTPSGAALAAHAEVVLGRMAAARDELAAIAGLRAGELRLATFASAGPSIVVPAVAAFHAAHPQVRLRLLEAGPDEAIAMLRAGELDVAVIHHYPALGPDPGPDLSCTALGEDPFALVLPPDHPLSRRRQRVPIAALASEAFLFPRSREGHGGTYDRLMRGACAVAGFDPHVLFEINDCQTVQAFVAAGLGPRCSRASRSIPSTPESPCANWPTHRAAAYSRHDWRAPHRPRSPTRPSRFCAMPLRAASPAASSQRLAVAAARSFGGASRDFALAGYSG